jgi:hypothetical protein
MFFSQTDTDAIESIMVLAGCAEARERKLLNRPVPLRFRQNMTLLESYDVLTKAEQGRIMPLPLMEPLLLVLAELQLLQPQGDLVTR